MTHESAPSATTSSIDRDEFGQVVLVLQGGGALGAYQAGTYQALHEAGLEPDWVIGTSIGAINACQCLSDRRQSTRTAPFAPD